MTLLPNCLWLVLTFLLAFPSTVSSMLIQMPKTQHHVARTLLSLTDPSRPLNPFHTTTTARQVELSVFYPIVGGQVFNASFMPPATAKFIDKKYSAAYGIPDNTFQALQVPLYSSNSNSQLSSPWAVFSPALGTSRFLYNVIAQTIAGAGFTVVTIDHPYDADVVELSDGRLIEGYDINTNSLVEIAVATRVQDVQFVLNKLSLPGAFSAFHDSACTNLPSGKTDVVVFGHSLGGATAAASLFLHLNQTQIVGAMDLDGSFQGSLASTSENITTPFAIFTHNSSEFNALPTFRPAWSHFQGFRSELMLKNSSHYTFSDLPLLAHQYGLSGPLLDELLGELSGTRGMQIICTYIEAFLSYCFKGSRQSAALFEKANQAYPEVQIVSFQQ